MTNSLSPAAVHLTEKVQKNAHRRALRYLCLTVFLLMSAPRLRVQLGPIPLYLIDLPLLLTAYFAMQVPKIRRLPLGGAVVVILAAAFVSEVSAGVRMGTLSEPLYLIGRTFLA